MIDGFETEMGHTFFLLLSSLCGGGRDKME